MNAFPIGISALAAGRRGLDLIGQNIANASTPGYHRQALSLVSRTIDGVQGIGVDVASITRFEAAPVRTAILRGNADEAFAATRLDARRQAEAVLGSGAGGIGDGLERFFNETERLTTRPDDTALRRPVLAAADDLARQFNAAAGDIDRLRNDLRGQITTGVDEINGFATRIAELNTRISLIEKAGDQANDLRDERDQLVAELSKRVDVRTVEQPFGVVNVLTSQAAIVVGEFANRFQVGPDASGSLVVTQTGVAQPLSFASGRLGGLLREFNVELPATRARLDGLAGELIRRVNQIQATGLGTSGALTSASGTVGVVDPTAPLATQNLPFPPSAGQLTITLTDTATGNLTNATIAYDPATQSLNDVAAAITAGTGGRVQATVDPTTNTLQLQAQAGARFDFAGRGPNPPPGSPPVPDTDTGGLLAGLGVNGLFTGTDAAGIAVRADILADPRLLAASRTGQPGDGTNLERLAAVRDRPLIAGRTLSGEFADIAGSVGGEVRELGDRQTALGGVLQSLNAQEQAVTGVDVNEELVRLLEYQRMVEGATKYLSVVNSALDSILAMIN